MLTMIKAPNVRDFWYSADWVFTATLVNENDVGLGFNETVCCVTYDTAGSSPSYCFRCFY